MKNPKKILSLALALSMTAGLFATTAFAKDADSYTDAGQINNKEAVSVLSGLGVIAGKGDGSSFDPTGNVTRAEMAKMITWAVLGDVDVSAFVGTEVPLNDLGLAPWAEGYMKYCYSQGFISGRGDGRFDPNANVTTAEAARMLLGAIGYHSEVQGYTGTNWKINTIRDAQKSEFFTNLSVAADKVLTRDEAAQLIYNAVQADLIERTSGVDRVDGTITDEYRPNPNKNLLKETFDANIWIGTFEGNQKSGAATAKGEICVNGKLDIAASNDPDHEATFPSNLDISNIGEQYKVIFKDGKTGSIKGQPDKNDTIYGLYKTGKTSVVNATLNDIANTDDYKAADGSDKGKIKVAGTVYDVASAAKDVTYLVTNYGVKTSTAPAAGKTAKEIAAEVQALAKPNGDTVKLVLNDQNKVEKIYVTETRIGVVSGVNNEQVSIPGVGVLKIADNDLYSGIAENDVVVSSTLYKAIGDDDSYTVVRKADTVSGTLTSYQKNEKATVNGTTYTVASEQRAADNKLVNATINKSSTLDTFADSLNETVVLYLVNGFVGFAEQTSASANNYSVITAKDGGTTLNGTFNGLKIQVLAADGTKTTLTVSDKSEKYDTTNKKYTSTGITVGDFKVGSIVTWSGNADNAKVRIEETTITNASVTYDKDAKTVNGSATAANAVLFYTTEAVTASDNTTSPDWAKTKATNARDQKTITLKNASCVMKNGRVVAIVGDATDTSTSVVPLTTSVEIGIVDSAPTTTTIDGDTYTAYSINGKIVNIKGSNDTLFAKGDIVAYPANTAGKYDNDNDFKKVEKTGYTAGQVKEVTIDGVTYEVLPVLVDDHNTADNTLTYYTAYTTNADNKRTAVSGNAVTKALKDQKIFYIDTDGVKAGSDYAGKVLNYDKTNFYYNALIFCDKNDNAKISFVVVDTANKDDIVAVTPASSNP